MALATAPVSRLHGRRGVPTLVTVRETTLADLYDELTARKAEAVVLVTGLLPLVAFVTNAAREVGPREYQAAIAIAARLRRYRAQNEDPEPEGLAVAA
jgi:hypothetical protein